MVLSILSSQNKAWVIKALDRGARRTVAWVLGRRDSATFRRLYRKVRHLKRCTLLHRQLGRVQGGAAAEEACRRQGAHSRHRARQQQHPAPSGQVHQADEGGLPRRAHGGLVFADLARGCHNGPVLSSQGNRFIYILVTTLKNPPFGLVLFWPFGPACRRCSGGKNPSEC